MLVQCCGHVSVVCTVMGYVVTLQQCFGQEGKQFVAQAGEHDGISTESGGAVTLKTINE